MSPGAEQIRSLAQQCGFVEARISDLGIPESDAERLRQFAQSKELGDMQWFARSLPLRINPHLIMPEARSAVVLAALYRSQQHEQALASARYKIARYAGGRDYHRSLRRKAERFVAMVGQYLPPTAERLVWRICVDSAPLAEKVLARQAGLGWQGKHTNLIHPEFGSYFLIVVVLWNLELPPQQPLPDLCRDCRLCVDACPTGALEEYRIEPTRCISYWTIERRSQYDADIASATDSWVFGCDICQEVCPYNRNRRARQLYSEDPDFQLRAEALHWMQFGGPADEKEWEEKTRGSPLRRPGFVRLKENFEAVDRQRKAD
ncbi:MAG: tRNA epoxyqueuosine(34) reductase QueG [Leptospirales bacterium]|nr:tRNA epoxyqueuosine(34) reductase QueG [Leptospirales bacterium]